MSGRMPLQTAAEAEADFVASFLLGKQALFRTMQVCRQVLFA